jgi:hypothetical protein
MIIAIAFTQLALLITVFSKLKHYEEDLQMLNSEIIRLNRFRKKHEEIEQLKNL